MQRFYAITDSMQVMPESCAHLFHIFTQKTKSSITAEEAVEFFYSSSLNVMLYEAFNDALAISIQQTAFKCAYHDRDKFPNRHQFYTTPIFIVEVPMNHPMGKRHTTKVEFTGELENKIASEHDLSDHASREVKYYCSASKENLRVIAVEITHPFFKLNHSAYIFLGHADTKHKLQNDNDGHLQLIKHHAL